MLRKLLYYCLIPIIVVLAWATIAYHIVPPVIASAYRNESYTLLNQLIRGRDVHPLSHYLTQWNGLAIRLGIALAILSPLLAVAASKLPVLARDTDLHGMGRGRIAAAGVVICTVIGGSLYDIVMFQEHWPFSNYPMYSDTLTELHHTEYRVIGHVYDGSEIDLKHSLHPYDCSRLNTMLTWQSQRGTIQQTAEALLNHYNRQRLGSPLRQVRIYKYQWNLDVWARNVNNPERCLLAEVTLPESD